MNQIPDNEIEFNYPLTHLDLNFSFFLCLSRSLCLYPNGLLARLVPDDEDLLFEYTPSNNGQSYLATRSTPKTHICRECGRRYGRPDTLLYHCRYECGKTPRFKCAWCDYRTKWSGNLTKHRRSRHWEEYRAWVVMRTGHDPRRSVVID